jgi:hypothetical protein
MAHRFRLPRPGANRRVKQEFLTPKTFTKRRIQALPSERFAQGFGASAA